MRDHKVYAEAGERRLLIDALISSGITIDTTTPSGVAPVTGYFSGTGVSSTFIPNAGRNFNVSLWDPDGTFVGSVQLERSFDSGTIWLQAAVERTDDDTFFCLEPEFGVSYRLNCTVR